MNIESQRSPEPHEEIVSMFLRDPKYAEFAKRELAVRQLQAGADPQYDAARSALLGFYVGFKADKYRITPRHSKEERDRLWMEYYTAADALLREPPAERIAREFRNNDRDYAEFGKREAAVRAKGAENDAGYRRARQALLDFYVGYKAAGFPAGQKPQRDALWFAYYKATDAALKAQPGQAPAEEIDPFINGAAKKPKPEMPARKPEAAAQSAVKNVPDLNAALRKAQEETGMTVAGYPANAIKLSTGATIDLSKTIGDFEALRSEAEAFARENPDNAELAQWLEADANRNREDRERQYRYQIQRATDMRNELRDRPAQYADRDRRRDDAVLGLQRRIDEGRTLLERARNRKELADLRGDVERSILAEKQRFAAMGVDLPEYVFDRTTGGIVPGEAEPIAEARNVLLTPDAPIADVRTFWENVRGKEAYKLFRTEKVYTAVVRRLLKEPGAVDAHVRGVRFDVDQNRVRIVIDGDVWNIADADAVKNGIDIPLERAAQRMEFSPGSDIVRTFQLGDVYVKETGPREKKLIIQRFDTGQETVLEEVEK